jgi:hypothetical protein
MFKEKIRNIFSISIGFVTYIQIFGSNFLFSKTSFFFTADHPTYLAGYLSYINDSWKFPLTFTNNLFSGNSISIIFMDSIPLYSTLLKTIYSLFGYKVFNPFPFWYLVCYLLFGYYAGKILNIKIKNNFVFAVSLLLLINTPLMVNRMVWHASLSAHWIILASIYYYLINKKNGFNSLNIFGFVGSLSIFIHIYIFTMIASIYLVTLLLALKLRKLKDVFYSLFISSSILIIYFIFFFSTGDGVITMTYDFFKYGAEFNSFFCGEFPIDIINEILWCYTPYTAFGIEGYGYLGLGFIFLFSLLIFIPNKVYLSIKSHFLISLCLFFMTLYSFGNKWKIAHYQFYEFQPLFLHSKLLELFRATGRYIWPVCYFIMVFLIFRFASLKNKYLAIFIMVISLSLQLYDMDNIYERKSSLFKIDISTNQQADFAREIYLHSPEEILYLLPDERCSWGEIDHYIVALYYLNNGGMIQSTRTARLKINPEICKGYSVESDIENNTPYHFLINDIGLIQYSEIKNNYNCIPIESFVESNRRPSYCKRYTSQ